jgi:hypothetical protein
METIDALGIGWDKVQQETKISYALLKLYANSGPVPVTIIKKLKTFVDAQAK